MDKTSYDFLDVLRGTIEDKVSTLDQTIYCKIVGINEDYTLDVTIVPDEITRNMSLMSVIMVFCTRLVIIWLTPLL